MANNIFQNIGKGVSDIAGAGLGALGGIDRALRPGFHENQELRRKLQILQQMPQGSPAQAKYARTIMEQHGPDIMKNMPQGAYQGQQEATTGKPPWWTDPAMRDKFPEETGIAGGTKPRATDPWVELGRMSEAEANLGVDPGTGKPRFPGLTNKINRRINEFQFPGSKEEQSAAERKSLLWPITEGPVPPGTGKFRKTGEGISPGSSRGVNREYGQPQKAKTAPPEPVDYDRIEKMLGKDNADMEQKAWGIIYDVWDHLPRKLQDAIRAKEQQGISFTEILQYDEVKAELETIVK